MSVPPPRGRARVAVAALLTGALGACSGDVIGEFPTPPSPVITASATPETAGGILAEISVDGSPCFVAEAAGRVWVTAFDGNRLIEIDPATNEVVNTYRVPEGPCGMVLEGRTLWVESPNAGTVVAFDPQRTRIVDRLRVPGGVVGLASAPSGVWGIATQAEQAVRMDPATMRIVGRVPVDPPLSGLVVDGEEIWTISGREELVRIDPASHTIVERIRLGSFEAEGLAIGGDSIWLSSSFEGNVVRVDRRAGRVVDRLPVDSSLLGGIVIGGDYWVSANDGTVYRLDGVSGEVVDEFERVGFGPIPAAGNLWTVDFVSNTVFRLDERAT